MEKHVKVKPRTGQKPGWEYHVSFFGENTRAWVVSSIKCEYYYYKWSFMIDLVQHCVL